MRINCSDDIPKTSNSFLHIFYHTFRLCLISWEGLYGKEIHESVKKALSFLSVKIREIGITIYPWFLWQVSLLTAKSQ